MGKKYCKAYYLKDIRKFTDWQENPVEGSDKSSDDDIVYVWDDFTVVKSPVLSGGVVFDRVTPEWKNFCQTTLQFAIPEDLRYAYEDGKEEQSSSESIVREASKASL
ncbi:hypothetical protein ccbrp13_56710 [Ktedonobacteria bacterium brp13]|nr:hypothetical protein ccbrp13_56710 [Ktedonobacteria bacterium brp13]